MAYLFNYFAQFRPPLLEASYLLYLVVLCSCLAFLSQRPDELVAVGLSLYKKETCLIEPGL
ncbi:uncharacterized protein G2W53_024543 [Senna tora]|uniref:Uncharacterized protein n=1 Tax=Senna tora TaxID=362788 RepID=A0A834TBG0_9FABA|nr:uncharacterized protein G2W53_024543 [Senna tora]